MQKPCNLRIYDKGRITFAFFPKHFDSVPQRHEKCTAYGKKQNTQDTQKDNAYDF